MNIADLMKSRIEKFCYKKRCINFYAITGEVISSSKYVETNVKSTGGGGSIGRNGGTIKQTKVESENIVVHEMWLKTPDEKEYSFVLKGESVPVREGHQVTLIGTDSVEENSIFTTLVNHSAQEISPVLSAESVQQMIGFMPKLRLFVLSFLAVCLYALVSGEPVLSLATFVLAVAMSKIYSSIESSRMRKSLSNFMAEHSQGVLKAG